MSNNEFLKPGIASVALALLFPLFWISSFQYAGHDIWSAYRNDLTSLNWSDFLMITIGALEVYIYLSLRRVLNNFLGSPSISIALLFMAIFIGLFHLMIFVDVFLVLSESRMSSYAVDNVIEVSTITFIVIAILYSISAIIFSLLFLFSAKEMPVTLKVFAVLLLLCAISQLTFFLALMSILLFPIALITLAVYFFKEPGTVEVV